MAAMCYKAGILVCGKVTSPVQYMPDISKGVILALFGKHYKEHFDELCGVGVNEPLSGIAPPVISQRRSVGVVLAHVYLACSHTVAEHLRNIDERHFNGFIALCLGAVVVPVFKVMLVPALVVHPCGAVAFKLTLCLVGAAGALIHFAAYPEFLGAVF